MSGLAKLPPDQQKAALERLVSPKKTERDRDLQRKRNQALEASRIEIPNRVDAKRREKCLADPVRFLWTYGAPEKDKPVELQNGKFWMPFARHHKRMIAAIWERAQTGGDKAVAAPRGEGKTTICFWMLIVILLAELRYHPCGIGQTNLKAKEEIFDPIVHELTYNPLLYDDFPRVCYPLRSLDGAPLRARKQHIDGAKTHIEATQSSLVLPTVPGSPYGGMSLDYYGFDSAIRGSRHDFALINDPEKREAAESQSRGGKLSQHEKIELMIDSDIAGLAFPNSTIPRVVITTIQNRRCASYRLTSRDVKEGGRPGFEGERYGIIEKWPDRMDLWDEYVAKRQLAQADDRVLWLAGLGWSKGLTELADKDAWSAVWMYQTRREEMDAGAVVSNPLRYDQKNPAELSALQSFFNKVVDWKDKSRVMAELQNDPEEEETEQTLGLTPGLVASRISGLNQNCLPDASPITITAGMDIGNRVSHWWKLARWGNAILAVIDEGVMETRLMIKNPDQDYLTKALLEALHNWRTKMVSENPPDFGLLDSGDGRHQPAIYEFVRHYAASQTWGAAKGWDTGRFPELKVNEKTGRGPGGEYVFEGCFARHMVDHKIWLYHVHGEYCKRWLQERFVTPTFDHNNQFNDGSISLFAPQDGDPKRWLEFSQQICSEGREELFIPGKGWERKWRVYNKNNHKLDAGGLAIAAQFVKGMKLIAPISMQKQPRPKVKMKQTNPRFKRSSGPWVPQRGR